MTTKLEEMIKKFVDDQQISCGETIYQSERVIENAYEFIYELVNEVGYWYKEEEYNEYEEQLEWEQHREETWVGNYDG